MNVLIMANYATPKSGNFAASLLELAIRMRRQGNDVCFAFPENHKGGYTWSKWIEKEGFRVYLLDFSRNEYDLLNDLRELISRHKIDLIHSHFGCCRKFLMKKGHKLDGVKILYHDHMDYSPERNLFLQKILYLAVSVVFRIRGIGVVSVMQKKSRVYRLCGKKRNWWIPNGLSMRRNVEQSLSREDFRSEQGIAKDDIVVLFLGWDMYRKGLDIAVKAVDLVRKKYPSAQLGLAGFQDCAPEKLEWIREKTGIDPHCGWIRYFPSFEDMFACHRAADVYLSASRKEAFSYGLLEAMSQNTPVVVSDIEGTAWAKEYSKAVLYETEDANACAEALMRALEAYRGQPSNFEQMASGYSIDLWCQRVIDVYRQMLTA